MQLSGKYLSGPHTLWWQSLQPMNDSHEGRGENTVMPFTLYSLPWDQAAIRCQQNHILLSFILCSILLLSFPYRFVLPTLLSESLALESPSQAIVLKIHSYLRQGLATLLFRHSTNPSVFIYSPSFCLKLQCLESRG